MAEVASLNRAQFPLPSLYPRLGHQGAERRHRQQRHQHSLMRRLVYSRSTTQHPEPEKLAKHERGLESPGKGSGSNVNNALLMVRNLVQHFNHRDQSDIAVRVAERRFYLHKILLARSEVFRTMMLGQFWDDSRQQEIELQESEECVPHMEAFFRYFYTAEINLSRENVVPLLVLSNKYNVKDLEESCERYANKLVFSGTETDIVIEWWHLAAQLNLKLLQHKCKDYLLLNMDSVLNSSHFTELSLEYLELFLAEKDMVVRSEYTLYRAVLRWLNHGPNQPQLTANLTRLLPLIKFSMMTVDELLEIEQSLETQPEFRKHLCQYLYTAFKFHAIPFHKRGTAGLQALDSPRLYTNSRLPKVGAMLRLHPYEREQLATGVTHNISIPISLSNADRDDCKNWHLVFHEVDERIQLEICSALCNSEQFDLVEASVLIYKQINGITFVKGVMQFRCCLKNMPDVPCGHVFNVLLPKESLDPTSPYLISGEAGDFCQFCIVWRHYHGDVFTPTQNCTSTASSGDAPQAATADQQPSTSSPHTMNLLPPRSSVENLSPSS